MRETLQNFYKFSILLSHPLLHLFPVRMSTASTLSIDVTFLFVNRSMRSPYKNT